VTASPAVPKSPATLRRAMGFRDLLLFYIITGFSIRWISTAASAGPSAIIIWLMGCVALYIPLVFTVLELSSRYPDEGGCYIWSKRAFGDFAGFITGWTYWVSNLPYFPGLLYFTAANALFIGGPSWQHASNSPLYFIIFSLVGLTIAVGLNVAGLNIGKWLHNLGAVGFWLPTIILMGLGLVCWIKFGSATEFTRASLVPSTHLKDIIFWSTVTFSLSGLESASMMGDEIQNPRRNIPRALLAAGGMITFLYVLATVALLVALPRDQILNLQGFMTAIISVSHRIGLDAIAVLAAILITLGGLGQAGAWFATSGRLPFVAGIDRFLPTAFGRVHPRYGSPYVSLLTQALIAAVFIFLGQAGTTVKGAYDVLVSMSIISYFLPYLFMFASMVRLQREPAGPEVMRVPGGRAVAIPLAVLGFITTLLTIGLALVPADDEPNKALAVTKVVGLTLVLVLVGALVYSVGQRRRQLASFGSLDVDSI
jgi:amino acid transporter